MEIKTKEIRKTIKCKASKSTVKESREALNKMIMEVIK